MYGSCTRLVGDEVKGTEMTGVEHLGQYVYEMTKAKIEASKVGGQPLAIEASEDVYMEGDEEDDGESYGNGDMAEAEPAKSEAIS